MTFLGFLGLLAVVLVVVLAYVIVERGVARATMDAQIKGIVHVVVALAFAVLLLALVFGPWPGKFWR